MAKVELLYDHRLGGKAYLFKCPGCGENHVLWERLDSGRPGWTWNGDFDRPTVNPSILLKTELPGKVDVCHSFITNGRIQFLPDCTHPLAGKTVELPDVEE